MMYQTASLQKQINDLSKEGKKNTKDISFLGESVRDVQTAVDSQGGMINLLNNGDFSFNDTEYNTAAYAGSDDVAADWYVRAQTQTPEEWLISTFPATPSVQILEEDILLNTYWNKDAGVVNVGGGDILGQKLFKKYFTRGNKAYIRCQVHKEVGATVDPTIRLQASIFDNTSGQRKVIEGAVNEITAVVQGTAGSFTRKYILEIITSSGSYFSNITVIPQVTTALSVTDTTDLISNYVAVDWDSILESQAYKLYRHDSEFNEWRIIAEIVNGNSSFRDVGGRTGEIFTPPLVQINPKALAQVKNFGAGLTETPKDVVMAIRMPSNYDFSVTTEQWFQLEFVGADSSDLTPTEVSAGGIIIDKIGLSFANGRFLPSAKDQQSEAEVQTITPPPSSGGGGGGGIDPNDGDGGFGCVVPTTLIYALNSATNSVRQVFASQVYVGMILVGKDRHGRISASRVKSIFHATTSRIQCLFTREYGFALQCSPSQPIIQNVDDNDGVSAHIIKPQIGAEILVSPDGKTLVQDYLSAYETIEKFSETIIFEMEDETMTFIGNNVVLHNLLAKA